MTHIPETQDGINPARAFQAQARALRIHAYGGAEVARIDTLDAPHPGPGQVLVQVKSAGINSLDWKVREGYVRDAFPLALPATLGIELAGVVLRTDPGATRFKLGDRVMGPLAGLGAYADLVVVDEDKLNLIPAGLSDVEAGAIPVASLTAWQVLQSTGQPLFGKRILIHGAAGGVGGFAVQFAKAAGAIVLATASAASRAHVLGLGADTVIDYRAERFEDTAAAIDLVIDLVGGETLDRSWGVLAPGGLLVSTAAPDVAARAPVGHVGQWFAMRPDSARLAQIARDVAAGRLVSTIAEVVGFGELSAAIERNRTGHAPGKTVVDLGR